MKNNRQWILIRTILTASGIRNVLKYEKDSKKRNRAIGTLIGYVIAYALLAVFAVMLTIGLGLTGLISAVPVLCATIVSLLELVFSILRVGDYLFSRKDYEILMAMPFSARELVSAKFLAMYLKNLPFSYVISMALMCGYGYFARPVFPVYLLWIVLTFFLPLIPTVLASVIGVLGTAAGAGFKHKNVFQSIFIFAFTIAMILLGQIAGRLFDTSEKAFQTMSAISGFGNTAGGFYPPAQWFSNAILKTDPLGILLLVGVSIGLFELVFYLISRSYRRINTRMASVSTGKEFKMQTLKTRSVVHSITFKEWRRFTGSTLYITNAGIGPIMVLILSVLILFLDPQWLISIIAKGAPVKPSFFIPLVPGILYFFLGMAATTAMSLSLEGKNFWILQSLPIRKMDIFKGKMLFNIYLTVPFMLFGCLILGIRNGASITELLLTMVCGVCMCLFSTAYGLRCNIRHLNLTWDKEVEVIKQGAAMLSYLLPNMILTFLVVIMAIVFQIRQMGSLTSLLITIVLYVVLALLCFLSIRKTALDEKSILS